MARPKKVKEASEDIQVGDRLSVEGQDVKVTRVTDDTIEANVVASNSTEETGEVGEPEPGTVPAKNPPLAPGVGQYFLGLAKNMTIQYGTLGLKQLIKSADKAVTTVESLQKADGTPYTGKQKFNLATQLVARDAKEFGKAVAIDALQTLIQISVTKLFGK